MQKQQNSLIPRHIGPNNNEQLSMLKTLGYANLEELSNKSIPKDIQYRDNLGIGPALSEAEGLELLASYAKQNKIFKTYIGMGYNTCIVPSVIQRNILENPGWYTQYTPYQAEISQGRLEALLNFQTMIIDLTGFPIANASLLDEGTAAAEAMNLAFNQKPNSKKFFVSEDCHPQSIEVIRTRAEALDIEVVLGKESQFVASEEYFGCLLQYPNTRGHIQDYTNWIAQCHKNNIMVCMAADILSLCLLKSPAELGADIAIGTTQRFGLGMFYGGPHAAYFATSDKYKRQAPGRIIGLSKDATGKNAMRLALQTREQHIRRDKATSNICTAQVLLAVAASMYAVYHGPEGLKNIAQQVHINTNILAKALKQLGFQTQEHFFDCLEVVVKDSDSIISLAQQKEINLRRLDLGHIGIHLDESTRLEDIQSIVEVFAASIQTKAPDIYKFSANANEAIPASLRRTSAFLQHKNFNSYHSETEFLRYITRLQSRDLSLANAMIPLGSCTMKLNATSEMLPISWPEFANLHPFAPKEQALGYHAMFNELESMLAKITGFDAVSLQPNAGSQGEYAGLLCIRKYHLSRGDKNRNICLIPTSAHGTNPASAVMAGMKVVAVSCDNDGNIDIQDLKAKAELHKDTLSCLMITYPSTHGVFESGVREICQIIHNNGGQVYMDGANMNAQVGLCRPGDFGPDVCHLNLHKTFAIPHGGGGPGMGPICTKKHLAPFLPGNKTFGFGPQSSLGAISAAPWGSSLILNISWAYIKMMGDEGLKASTQLAILNANYMAKRLSEKFKILYTDKNGLVAHECIIDCRPLKELAGIEVVDVAKRLMDYGFHSPTMSWPVIGTLMIEPTESESKQELDRFCDAMLSIYAEAEKVASGQWDKQNNPLKNAPHTAEVLIADKWDRPYSREVAAYPSSYTRYYKFWPYVSRVDDAYGDRNLVCSCPSMDEY